MPRFVRSDVASAIDIQTGAVVSRVIFSDNRIKNTSPEAPSERRLGLSSSVAPLAHGRT